MSYDYLTLYTRAFSYSYVQTSLQDYEDFRERGL